MTVGLPGTGIGGVFYLLSALFMPIQEIVKTVQGKSSISSWLLVLRQLSMGILIICAMWGLGIVAALVYDFFVSTKPVAPGLIRDLHAHLFSTAFHLNVFHIAPIVMSVVTLSAIIMLTNILRVFIRPLAEEV